jgi:hypothetical protein
MTVQLPDDLPPDVARLGEPIAAFRAGGGRYAALVIFGILAVLLGLAFLAGAVLLLVAGPGKGHTPVAKVVILGIACLSGGVATLRQARSVRGLSVYAFADGVARLQGAKAEVMRWDDVNTVKRIPNAKAEGMTLARPTQLILTGRDGRELVFNESLSRLGDLRKLVEERTLRTMLPAAQEAFDGGAAIGFGKLGVSPDGIHHGNKTLPWEDLKEAKVEDGSLVVRSAGAWLAFCKVPLGEVPNSHVLLALIERAAPKAE